MSESAEQVEKKPPTTPKGSITREEEYKDAVMQDLYNDISSSDEEDSAEEKEITTKAAETEVSENAAAVKEDSPAVITETPPVAGSDKA